MTSSNSDRRRLGEFQLIAKYFAPLAAKAGAFKLSDDAAVVNLAAGREMVVTVDAVVEGVHFFKSDPAAAVAQKALRVNLSDLAAKGAALEGYLLALSLPDWVDDSWLAGFAEGLADDQKRYGISLIGGDTTATPGPLTLSITALGSVATGRMLRRSGAQAGDAVFVSGTIGDAGAGLSMLKDRTITAAISTADREFLLRRYRLPEPRVGLGQALADIATASLDVSDGLIADLGHVAEASQVRIRVEAARVPLSPAFVAFRGSDAEAVAAAATAGDDYELAFTAPESARTAIAEAALRSGVAVSEIGRVEAGSGVILCDGQGRPIRLEIPGFTHF